MSGELGKNNEKNSPLPELIHQNSRFLTTLNWDSNIRHWAIWTGIPERANQLTDKENLNSFFERKDIAFGQFYLGANFLAQKKWPKSNQEILESTPVPINGIAYSSGILAFRNLSSAAIANISELILVNPLMGNEVIADKYAFVRGAFPNSKKIKEEVGPMLNRLAQENRLRIVLSMNDEFFVSNRSEKIIKEIVPKFQIEYRERGHAISPDEVNKWFESMPIVVK